MTTARLSPVALTLLSMALGGLGAGTATVLAQQSTGDAGQHAAGATTTPTTTTAAPTTTTTTTTRPKPSEPSKKKSTAPRTTTTTTTSTTTRETTTTQSPKPAAPSAVQEVVDLVNQARADAGCSAVRVDQRLVQAADKHSEDMDRRDYFSHDTPEGEDFAERIEAEGYPKPGAENIAQGQRSAEQVMDAWMDSDGHRANILNCDLRAIGVGLSESDWLWTQDFGY